MTLSHINLSSTTFGTVVRIGNTSVVCGISAELAEPSVANPGHGYIGTTLVNDWRVTLVPNVVLSPLSNPKHKAGPPSDEAQSLSAQMLALILAISPELPSSLCIERGKCVWTLYIDIQFLNYDGNGFDAAWLALTAALSKTQLPPIQFNPDLNRGVVVDGFPARLEWPEGNIFACSFVGIDDGKYLLIDPDQEEEELSTASVCIVIDQDRRIRHLYKGGVGLGREGIKKCIDLASERAGYLSFILEESAGKPGISN